MQLIFVYKMTNGYNHILLEIKKSSSFSKTFLFTHSYAAKAMPREKRMNFPKVGLKVL